MLKRTAGAGSRSKWFSKAPAAESERYALLESKKNEPIRKLFYKKFKRMQELFNEPVPAL